jgi:hypothetical protein
MIIGWLRAVAVPPPAEAPPAPVRSKRIASMLMKITLSLDASALKSNEGPAAGVAATGAAGASVPPPERPS